MNKIYLPSVKLQYFELKVYNIHYSLDIKDTSFVTIVAPDSYVALSVFTALYPARDVLNVHCIGPCVSVFPEF